jgi:hypothetical protein
VWQVSREQRLASWRRSSSSCAPTNNLNRRQPMSSSDEEAPRRKTGTRSREALYSQGTPPSRQRAVVRPRLLAAAAEDEDFEDGLPPGHLVPAREAAAESRFPSRSRRPTARASEAAVAGGRPRGPRPAAPEGARRPAAPAGEAAASRDPEPPRKRPREAALCNPNVRQPGEALAKEATKNAAPVWEEYIRDMEAKLEMAEQLLVDVRICLPKRTPVPIQSQGWGWGWVRSGSGSG